MMPPVPPLLESPLPRTVRRRRSMIAGFVTVAFALAGTRAASANFAPPPITGEQRPAVDSPASSPAPPAEAAPVPAGAPAQAAPSAGAAVAPAAPLPHQTATVPPAQQPVAQPARRPAVPSEIDDEESLRAFAEENPAPHTRLNVAAWISTGVTVALLGVAGFYAAKAGEKASDVNRLTRNFDPATDLPVEYAVVADQYTSAMRDGKHDARLAKGFAIAAGATALTSAALFVIDALRKPGASESGKKQALVTPMVTAQSAGLGVGGTF